MVETAGVESGIGAFRNYLTTRDFWAKRRDEGNYLPSSFPLASSKTPQRPTRFAETLWRRRDSMPAARV